MPRANRNDPYARAAKHGWNYRGDINLEYGGLFWKNPNATDYVEAVCVTPVSDAGGADNEFWVENGSIYFPPEPAARNSALACIGWYDETKIGPYPLWALVDAFAAYAGVERNYATTVRIGKKQESREGNQSPDRILPGNAVLLNYVESFLD